MDLILHPKWQKAQKKKQNKKNTKKFVTTQMFWSLLYIAVCQGILSCPTFNMDVVVVDK